MAAWVDLHFPMDLGNMIEGGSFPSIHYMFNIVTAEKVWKNLS